MQPYGHVRFRGVQAARRPRRSSAPRHRADCTTFRKDPTMKRSPTNAWPARRSPSPTWTVKPTRSMLGSSSTKALATVLERYLAACSVVAAMVCQGDHPMKIGRKTGLGNRSNLRDAERHRRESTARTLSLSRSCPSAPTSDSAKRLGHRIPSAIPSRQLRNQTCHPHPRAATDTQTYPGYRS